MLIAIDETGDFDLNSNKFNFFVASHIQTENGLLEIKKKQYDEWEKSIDNKFRDKYGEVKGSLLKEDDLFNFITKVVCAYPEIRFNYTSIVPNSISKNLIKKHKDFEIKQLQCSLENFKKSEAPKKSIKFLESYSSWLNKRSENQFLKLLLLRHCVSSSLHNTMIYSIADDRINEIDEILNIKFKIDNDFISNDNLYWKAYLKRSILNQTETKPIVFLSDWKNNHPIRLKYYNPETKRADLTSIFKDNFNFLDSKSNFEIQITDIAAIIINRYWNSDMYIELNRMIVKMWTVRDAHIRLMLNDFDPEEKLNSYILKE